jgi:hypothetical protein
MGHFANAKHLTPVTETQMEKPKRSDHRQFGVGRTASGRRYRLIAGRVLGEAIDHTSVAAHPKLPERRAVHFDGINFDAGFHGFLSIVIVNFVAG